MPSEPLLKLEGDMKAIFSIFMIIFQHLNDVKDEKMIQTLVSFVEDATYDEIEDEEEREYAKNPKFSFDKNDTKIKDQCEELFFKNEYFSKLSKIAKGNMCLIDHNIVRYPGHCNCFNITHLIRKI